MRKRSNPDSEANIRRIDTKARASKQTHGFQVHLLRGESAVTKLFSDTRFGGKEGARRAARKFRREMLGDLPERVFRGPVPAAKRSGAKRPAKAASGSKNASRSKKSRGR
ncbi:MAG: hypothetical protein M3Z64_10585 [Verrucomicrobiota bacterium]|nr:hypothetical protein [Verrucomicrobiota bacterium]